MSTMEKLEQRILEFDIEAKERQKQSKKEADARQKQLNEMQKQAIKDTKRTKKRH